MRVYTFSRDEFKDFMQRADEAGSWDEIDEQEWETACKYAGLDYHSYDDPDSLWDDLTAYRKKEAIVKRYFVKTNAYNMVAFVDSENWAFAFMDGAFDEPLTLEVAKAADYSNIDGCETAIDIAYSVGADRSETFKFDDYENDGVSEITEF